MKSIRLIFMIILMVLLVVSCSRLKCDECGTTKGVKEVSIKGTKANLCEDCYDKFLSKQAAQDFVDSLNESIREMDEEIKAKQRRIEALQKLNKQSKQY